MGAIEEKGGEALWRRHPRRGATARTGLVCPRDNSDLHKL